jgi:hypothetical protein
MVFIPFVIQKRITHRSFSDTLSHLISALPLHPTYTSLIVLQHSSVTVSYQTPHIPSSKPRVHFLLLGSFQMVCSSPATCVTFRNTPFFFLFLRWRVVSSSPKQTARKTTPSRPSANIYSCYPPYTAAVSSIRNLMKHHDAVVTN